MNENQETKSPEESPDSDSFGSAPDRSPENSVSENHEAFEETNETDSEHGPADVTAKDPEKEFWRMWHLKVEEIENQVPWNGMFLALIVVFLFSTFFVNK